MKLIEKQHKFVMHVADLIIFAIAQGYDFSLGEAYRSKEEAARLAGLGLGIKNSLHTQRLAIDFNLFRDGQYLSATEDYRLLGEYWEAQSHPPDYECAWGGRFNDGGHFSIAHGGRR